MIRCPPQTAKTPCHCLIILPKSPICSSTPASFSSSSAGFRDRWTRCRCLTSSPCVRLSCSTSGSPKGKKSTQWSAALGAGRFLIIRGSPLPTRLNRFESLSCKSRQRVNQPGRFLYSPRTPMTYQADGYLLIGRSGSAGFGWVRVPSMAVSCGGRVGRFFVGRHGQRGVS